jgi:hypothetical protein
VETLAKALYGEQSAGLLLVVSPVMLLHLLLRLLEHGPDLPGKLPPQEQLSEGLKQWELLLRRPLVLLQALWTAWGRLQLPQAAR